MKATKGKSGTQSSEARVISAAMKLLRGRVNPANITGRPRSSAERCPCQVMTLKRAEARGKSYEHDPSCSFYPDEPRALVI